MNKPSNGIGNLGSKLMFIDNNVFWSLGVIIQVPTKLLKGLFEEPDTIFIADLFGGSKVTYSPVQYQFSPMNNGAT